MKNYLCNMIVNIKNGQMAKKNVIISFKKKSYESFLKILWSEGFISGYKIDLHNQNSLEIFLKYTKNGKPIIKILNSLSKPSKKVYYSFKQIWKLDSSRMFMVFSTNHGLKSLNECKKQKIGGELLFLIN